MQALAFQNDALYSSCFQGTKLWPLHVGDVVADEAFMITGVRLNPFSTTALALVSENSRLTRLCRRILLLQAS